MVNQYKSRTDQTFEHTNDEKRTVQKLIQLIQQGKRVICPCMDKGLADRIYTLFNQTFGDTKKALIYTRDNPCQEMNIDELWKQYDLVIFTSTIDCGLSFEVKGHFDVGVCFFNDLIGPTFDAGVQMLSRSRFDIFVECPPSNLLT